jgi:ribose transport system ATP-binding protein
VTPASTSDAADSSPAGAPGAGGSPVIRLEGLHKHFGGVQALADARLDVLAGEVHALIGENGAGKSTLVKCLAGAVTPDSGEIFVDEEPVEWSGPSSAIDAGIRVVYQELSLFPALTVAENVLGAEGLGGRWVRWGALRRKATDHLRSLGLDIDPSLRLEQLPVGSQQMVEIARALFSGARIIVLDEPTSALSPREIDLLFGLVDSLKQRGVAFVLITHFLDDVIQHADRVTVLRNGHYVETLPVADATKRHLVHSMIGSQEGVLRSTYEGEEVTLPPRSTEPVVLEATDVRLAPSVRGFSASVRRGEVVGIYGDLASGHFDFADTLFGVRTPDSGTVALDGDAHALRNATVARDAGVGFIPADRRGALALDQSISRNITLAHLHHTQGWILNAGREREAAQRQIDELRVANGTPDLAAGALSGGNQQKVLLARWLERDPKLLVLVEPTRGMDVGAKSEVIRIIRRLAQSGSAVVVVSAEPETVLALAHRVIVARRGLVAAEFADCALTKDRLLEEAS